MKIHLAILYKDYLDLILEGKKTIEARFSKVKCPPYGRVSIGDKILLKETGGPIRGEATVSVVKYFDNLAPSRVVHIVNKYKEQLQIKDNFLNQKLDSNYLTLIFLKDVVEVSPYFINKRDRRGWIVYYNHAPQSIQLDLFGNKVSDKEVKINPYYSECENGLHSFFKSPLKNSEGYPRCRNCGKDIIHWKKLHIRDLKNIDFVISELRKEWWRNYWWEVEIDEKAISHALRKNSNELYVLVRKRIEKSVGIVYEFRGRKQPYRDGYQIPYKGNIIYYAQHATATCCRKCIECWHGIPQGRNLNNEEIEYLTMLVMKYIRRKLRDYKRGVIRNGK
ncbi:DUF4186 family protein [Dehalococcoidia bacterium]|nr:DUF4186 family protein [Dehalococcoidia bacterium]MCL0104248.1 DUF4186 family protein [Dehalococcoidia bacterium]